MASIREHVETVFAALAFAERNLPRETQDLLDRTSQSQTDTVNATRRVDNRPRVRV